MKTLFILIPIFCGLLVTPAHFHISKAKSPAPIASKPASAEVHWMSIDKALALSEQHPKKIYVDIYTTWCGWCRKMDKESFTDPKVIAELNKDYYAVKYNAESQQEVVWNQNHYNYKPEYQANEFAVTLLNGQLAYPSGVIINEKQKVLTQVPGYQNAAMLVEILSYFGNNSHLSQSWTEYVKSHK